MIKNMIFEGGGVKGIAYAGALDTLEQNGLLQSVAGFGGTSAGAITACLCSLGLSAKDIKEILWSLNFKDFADDDWGIFRDTHRLINNFGWHKGHFFLNWLKTIFLDVMGKRDPTFTDIRNNGYDLRLIGANLSTGYSEVFSFKTSPGMSVPLAARISMSLPLFFQAVEFDNCIYVDGGLFRNYPIRLFDDDYFPEESLGLRVDSTEEIQAFKSKGTDVEKRKIVDFQSYVFALIKALLSVQEDRHLHSDDWKRTIHIDTKDISATDFDLSNETKKTLLEEGVKAAEIFLKNIF